MVLYGSPWLYTYFHCHQMITQQQPKGRQGSPQDRQPTFAQQGANGPKQRFQGQ